jgi:kexin
MNRPQQDNGTFLGWNMKFWGTTIDPAKAKQYEVPLKEGTLPPVEEPPAPATPTSSKMLAKPTALLPVDHGTAEGENTNPAFPSGTPSPTTDMGWFPDMANLVSNQKWFFVAAGAVMLFGISAAVFFWRRRRAARLSNYSTLPAGDDVSMSALTGRGLAAGSSRPTKELYDAFGEVSDDDDDDDETKALRGTHPQDRVAEGLGFHSGFLDDDEPPSAGGRPTPLYQDEPESAQPSREARRERSGTSSPSGSGGSWEHAS